MEDLYNQICFLFHRDPSLRSGRQEVQDDIKESCHRGSYCLSERKRCNKLNYPQSINSLFMLKLVYAKDCF